MTIGEVDVARLKKSPGVAEAAAMKTDGTIATKNRSVAKEEKVAPLPAQTPVVRLADPSIAISLRKASEETKEGLAHDLRKDPVCAKEAKEMVAESGEKSREQISIGGGVVNLAMIHLPGSATKSTSSTRKRSEKSSSKLRKLQQPSCKVSM